jgi:hypothetical protein
MFVKQTIHPTSEYIKESSFLFKVRQIFADGILEHKKTAMQNSWNGSKPKTLLSQLAILSVGLSILLCWSLILGLIILASFIAWHLWLFNYIYDAYVQ